jgi:predicted lipoprotein with Yx(FWY)xxD motif
MTRNRSLSVLAGMAAVPLAAVALAGCNGSSVASGPMVTPTPMNAQSGTVAAANAGSLGRILVDSQGRTLYLFRGDTGMKSTCFGECASQWPPLRAGSEPTVGGGIKTAAVGTTPRSDGKPQVTYNGHPLYLFSGDQQPGDTNGQGITAFGAQWFAVTPTGAQASGNAGGMGPASSGGAASGGGFSY